MDKNNYLLEETFYPLSNKSVTYNVKLTSKELILSRIDGSSVKVETLNLDDIVGCRCTRKKRKSDEKCICHPTVKLQPVDCSSNGKNLPKSHQPPTDISAYLHIYAYVIKNFMLKSGNKRERFTITLRFRSYKKYEDNMKEAQKWRNVLRQLISTKIYPNILISSNSNSSSESSNSEIIDSGDTVLVILNPKSGVGKSKEIFQERVVTILVEADLKYVLHVTQKQNDARDFVRSADIFKWRRGIVVIGGDGVLFEVINGIMERPDWKKAIEYISFGIIPGGSGNGLAKSLSFNNKEPYDDNPVLISTLNIVRGIATPVDLVRIETFSEVVFSFLSVGWGLLADIDIESERIRAIGSPRFTIWSLARLIGNKYSRIFIRKSDNSFYRIVLDWLPGLRKYAGRLSFLRIPDDKLQDALKNRTYIDMSLEEYMETFDDQSNNQSFDVEKQDEKDKRLRTESFYSVVSNNSDFHSVNESSYQSLPELNKTAIKRPVFGPDSVLPPLDQPVPQNWEVYQGDFVLVHAACQSHIGEDIVYAPQAKPQDGIIWLSVIKAGITRANLLQFLLGLSKGKHLNVPNVEMIPVLAFRLEPFTTGSHIVVDGEVIEHGPLQAEIFPGLISVFSRENN